MGVLIPRMTMAQHDLITVSADRNVLLIYQTDNTPGLYFYTGSNWEVMGSESISINSLTNGKTGGRSVFLDSGTGFNDDGAKRGNTAVGDSALYYNIAGNGNTVVGNKALYQRLGGYNVALGPASLFLNTYGSNIAIGHSASMCNTIGGQNLVIGNMANFMNKEDYYNTIIGYSAGMGLVNRNNSGVKKHELHGHYQ